MGRADLWMEGRLVKLLINGWLVGMYSLPFTGSKVGANLESSRRVRSQRVFLTELRYSYLALLRSRGY